MLVTDLVQQVVERDRPSRRSGGPGVAAKFDTSSAAERLDDARRRDWARRDPSPFASLPDDPDTLTFLQTLAVDLMFEIFEDQDYRDGLPDPTGPREARALNVPAQGDGPPALVILDPGIETVEQARSISDRINIDFRTGYRLVDRITRMPGPDSWWSEAQTNVFRKIGLDIGPYRSSHGDGLDSLLQLMDIVRPEVIVAPLPRMAPLGAPAPSVGMICLNQKSSVGVFCRDAGGTFGVTASFHGTGPAGTAVTVGGVEARVGLADPTQDIVFIPLPENHPGLAHCRGLKGARSLKPPYEAEPMSFDGVTSGAVQTYVKSHDAGITQRNARRQFCVQTRPDANRGDSGCALIDQDDAIVAFAFQTSAVGAPLEMTDWIWADNALQALGLTII
jgi:hypothetical protein